MTPSRSSYYRRVMGALVLVLCLAIALVRWWPANTEAPPDEVFREGDSERIALPDVQPTSQSREQAPPPPAPLPPVVVPNDVLVEQEIEIGESELRVETPEDDETLQEGTDRATASRQPDTGARLLRNVQPNYPRSARDDEVRARIEIDVEIAETGRVQAATIRRRWLLSGHDTLQPVPELGYGLEEAALAAARRALFRPARVDGQPVTTRKTITFTFGPD